MSTITYTKASGQLMDWTLLDDTGGVPFVETNALDDTHNLDTALEANLHIDICHADANAAGSLAEVKVWIKSGTTDEDWHEHRSLYASDGTANEASLDDDSGAGQANPERVKVASTTNFETPGDKYFLKDVNDLTNSCIVTNKDFVNDEYVENVDNLVGAYDNADKMYDIVDQFPAIELPKTVVAAKVTFHNQDADATYACRVRYTIIEEATIA